MFRYSIHGPDSPSTHQRLPWRLVVYKEGTDKISGTTHVFHEGPWEFKTLEEVVEKVREKEKEV